MSQTKQNIKKQKLKIVYKLYARTIILWTWNVNNRRVDLIPWDGIRHRCVEILT